jgi:hypothetical protein
VRRHLFDAAQAGDHPREQDDDEVGLVLADTGSRSGAISSIAVASRMVPLR